MKQNTIQKTDKNPVEKILYKRYSESVFHTHVSMIQPRGKFQFTRKELEEFFDTYCDMLENNDNPIVGVAEKAQEYLPILVDIDIKLIDSGKDYGEHIYDETHVSQVIDTYQSVLRNIVNDCDDKDLTCVLLEKPIYKVSKGENSYLKNGFHLHFPYIFLTKIAQEVHLIPRVQSTLNDMETFKDLGIENSADVVDKSCCKVPWLMYGSRKSEDMEPYLLSKIFDSDGNELDLETAFFDYPVYDDDEEIIPIKGRVKKYLPRILSIRAYNREVKEVKPGLVSPLKEKIMSSVPKKKIQVSTTEALKISAKLLPMLSQYRAEDRNEWMTIGWALFNIGEGSPAALEQWLEFSARDGEGYSESTCIYEWERMSKKDITLGTLRYYASVDSPEEYKKFKQEQSDTHIKKALNGSHNAIAKVLYEMYGNEFVCASLSQKLWYQYRDHKWEDIEEGIFLREKISSEITNKYVEMGKEIYNKLSELGLEDDKNQYQTQLKSVNKMIANLGSAPFKNNVMRECMEVFYDRRFQQKLDRNPYIIAFKNGVYDLKLNVFRDGRPEDFLSKSMGIEYDPELREDCEEVHFVYNYLEKMFPDSSLRRYFLDNASDVFIGINIQKTVIFWTGDGDNGKSVLQTIFEKMFGELAIKFNTSLITGKKLENGQANPELARAEPGVRWATLEEPNKGEQINDGIFKNLSGNDTILARDLFQTGKKTKERPITFKLTFICNKLPKLLGDGAVWNRARVLPFESTFVKAGDDCPDTYEEQLRQKRFPRDPDFTEKIPTMLQAFAWVLLQHRQKIKSRVEPAKVMEATKLYQMKNDIYRKYIEENILQVEGNIEGKIPKLSLVEIYAHFRAWHKEGFPGRGTDDRDEVKEYLERAWGEPERGNMWSGYRFRTLQDDIDSGEAVLMNDDDFDYEIEEEEDGNVPL